MIGLDANILVRYLTQDEPRQAAVANQLIESTLTSDRPGFVSTVALVELVWVLESGYDCDRAKTVSVIERLLRAKPLVIEQAELAWQAIRAFADSKADFADCMIERAARANGCEYTVTFDRSAAKGAGMRLLESRPA